MAKAMHSLDFPRPTFTSGNSDKEQRRFPQCIAHRGFSARYPENTLAAFRAGVKAGAHALEMDLQLTRDGVVVISHDPTLESQYGRSERIADFEWPDLQELRTVMPPHEPMPRLVDVLAWLSEPKTQHVWVLIEIKVGSNVERIMRSIRAVLQSMTPLSPNKAWNERIVFTVLPASYLTLAAEHLPGYPIAHIGFSRSYIRELLPVPGVAFNIALPLLILPGGSRLLAEAQKKYDKPVYAWVVNDEETMTWCIRRGLDGVLCDDPEKFLNVCRNFVDSIKEPWFPFSIRTYIASFIAVVSMKWRAWSKRAMLR